jgi:hypothetical protein
MTNLISVLSSNKQTNVMKFSFSFCFLLKRGRGWRRPAMDKGIDDIYGDSRH